MTWQADAIRSRFDSDRVSLWGTWALLLALAFLGLQVAITSRGAVPDYDAVDYIGTALRAHLGFMGALDAPGRFQWYGVGLTNSLDTLVLAVVYDLVDFHLAVWAIHTGYVVLFSWLLGRLLGRPTALFVTGWAFANVYFLHQYTNYISELKVGLFLLLFIAYLFHPDAGRHRAAIFCITILLIGLRTINLLFIVPLVAVYMGLRWMERSRRAEAWGVLKSVALGIVVLSPLLYGQVPALLSYVRNTTTRSQRNWLDMTGIYGKLDLLAAYCHGLLDYNARLQVAAAASALLAIVLVATRHRSALRGLAEPLLATAVVFAVLMQAATTNVQVVFWLFALEALLVGLIARSVFPARLVAVAGCLLAIATLAMAYSSFLAAARQAPANNAVQALSADMAGALRTVPRPVIYANFRGIGPLDTSGLEIRLGRVVRWPSADQVSYNPDMRYFTAGQSAANTAFIASGNFLWPTYIGVNRHTEEIARYFAEHAADLGWLPAQRFVFDDDPSRYVDVYLRPIVTVHLKWEQYGDRWMDLDTPIDLKLPGTANIPNGYELRLSATFLQPDDKAFVPPFNATLTDSAGKSVASATAPRYGDNVLAFPVGGLRAGHYRVRFERAFSSSDPRALVAVLNGVSLALPGAP